MLLLISVRFYLIGNCCVDWWHHSDRDHDRDSDIWS